MREGSEIELRVGKRGCQTPSYQAHRWRHQWRVPGRVSSTSTNTDIRIASENAKFGMVEIAHGMGGAAGGMQLGHSIAHVDAMYLALTGEMIDAKSLRHATGERGRCTG